jgi:class 3 adenylate cyclase/effector-binding domain-containing protein/streptogramin lyase
MFTDIEGSTQLLKSHREEYANILAEHHRLLREAFTAHGGKEIDNQGDAFFVAFSRAKDAVLAAASCQRALAKHSWQGGASPRVRMGIHTGEADRTADRYVGLSVHRAARICAVGHGGQVLVSQTTAGHLHDDEDDLPGLALKDLGEHQLKDISHPVRLYQLEIDGLRTAFPALATGEPPKRNRRRPVALAAAALVIAGAVALALALLSRDEATPKVVPNSLVRIDASTLEPTDVVPIGDAPDLVVASGGFVWVTHHILRDVGSGAIRNAGDRTLTRVDPSTGDAVTVGGGLAPCGLTADPSGDVWVANCYASGSGPGANVVRIDASTLDFEKTVRVPPGTGFYRALAYGGGSLWVSAVAGGEGSPNRHTLTKVDPRAGARRAARIVEPAAGLAWSDGYGDLWMSNFDAGTLSRLHAATPLETVESAVASPSSLVVYGDTVWVADWAGPQVARLPAVGSGPAHSIDLARTRDFGVWNVAAGAGFVWATTPRNHALWRIDPKTNDLERIGIPHLPSGVTVGDDELWVTVRGVPEKETVQSEPGIEHVKAQRVLLIREHVHQDELGKVVPRDILRVEAYLEKLGLGPAGPPICICQFPDQRGMVDAAIGWFVDRQVNGKGRIEPRTLPATRALVTTHVGPYATLQRSYRLMSEVMDDNGLTAADKPREIYIAGPGDVQDPNGYETLIVWPIKAKS